MRGKVLMLILSIFAVLNLFKYWTGRSTSVDNIYIKYDYKAREAN
jgi:hypothetical protein